MKTRNIKFFECKYLLTHLNTKKINFIKYLLKIRNINNILKKELKRGLFFPLIT